MRAKTTMSTKNIGDVLASIVIFVAIVMTIVTLTTVTSFATSLE